MSEIITDKLTGKASAGNVTITSEGGSATMQLQQGVAKAWIHQDDNADIRDSLNIASLTDVAVGKAENNFSNNFNNAYYSSGGSHNNRAVGNDMFAAFEATETHVPSTSSKSVDSTYNGSNFVDESTIVQQCFGDLA
jgi:hypothetical protein